MRLLDLFSEIFAYTAFLTRKGNPAPLSHEAARADIERLFSECLERGERSGVRADDLESGRFAVCAWVDECILTSEWEGRLSWLRNPLQRVLFRTAMAGEEFFERLHKLRPEQKELREVFSLCLALGFQGPLFASGESAVEEIKRKNGRVLWGEDYDLTKTLGKELFPQAYPTQDAVERRRSGWRKTSVVALVVMIGAPLLLVVLYWVYGFVLSGSLNDFFSSAR